MDKPSILIVDCEIVNMIPDKNKPKIDGLMYCDGWRDFQGMGISVIGVYSYKFDLYTPYRTENFEGLKWLMKDHEVIAGFNCIGFDFQLMESNKIIIPLFSECYDIYLEVKKAARAGKYAPGYNLDSIARENGLSGKTGHGEFAPKLWQEGKYQEVIDYCISDVRITKEILDLIMAGKLRNPVRPDEILDVRKPGAES